MRAYVLCVTALLAAALQLVSLGAQAASPSLTMVEYYHAGLDHYFITADAAEQAAVDKGAAGAWVRTGMSFGAYALGESSSAKSVCRFYSKSQNSHFYTANEQECASLKAGNSGWLYEGLVFALDVPTQSGCATDTQPIYRVYNNGFGKPVGSNHRFVADLALALQQAKTGMMEGIAFCAPQTVNAKRADAVRLLKQASFGPTFAEIDRVERIGPDAWIDEQLSLPTSRYTVLSWMPTSSPATCTNDRTLPLRPDSFCLRDNYGPFLPQKEFWQHALSNPDQLRQRVAWAWSQFFVISGLDIVMAYGMLDYQQMLRDHAFDNFEALLKKVSLHPSMGEYLDMANNSKPDPKRGITPNENYAREVLQLFSIGLNELNLDGTQKLDANGRSIPTYDNEEVEGFAHVFTGWTYPTQPGQIATPTKFNPRNFAGEMEVRENFHDLSAKELLDGVKTVPNATTIPDFDFAMRAIFMHRNVPPFVSKYLIQKLVTGNPSPQYVERVARVFLDNGQGIRGDMKSVVRAILLDPEARGAEKFDPSYGQLLEPVLFVSTIARALNVKTDGVYFRTTTPSLGQPVFLSPSVFNFYPPDGTIGANPSIVAPEFALLNSNTALSRINFADILFFTTGDPKPDATVYGATGTQLDWSPFTAVAANADALMDKVAGVLIGVPFSAEIKAAMRPAIEAVPATDVLTRAKTALYLAVVAPVGQVKR